jgi:hypothetical protein
VTLRAPILAAVIALLPLPLDARCRVGEETNEAKLLAWYAAPLTFSPGGVLEPMRAGGIRAALDITWIPAPDDELRRTGQCFQPKEENTQLASVLPRPRLAIGLPAHLQVEATWLPPITIADATPNLASVAVAFVQPLTVTFGVAVRGHATIGEVKGPITCPRSALQLDDPLRACYGTGRSDDSYEPNLAGVEGSITWRRGDRLAGYLGAGFTSLRPRFRVGFQHTDGVYDSTRVLVDLERVSAMAGIRYRLSSLAALTGELYAVPEDVVLVRVGGGWRLR